LGNVLIGDGRPSRGLPSLKVRKRSLQKWGRNKGLKFGVIDNLKSVISLSSLSQWEIKTLISLEPLGG